MKKNHQGRIFFTKKIIVISVIVSLLGTGILIIPMVSAQENTWNLPLRITESSGKEATVALKGSPASSDGEDIDDIPIPPPPMPPYVRAWLTTPFSLPFNTLLNESKHMPSQYAKWNLSIIWAPELENESNTTITIYWNPTQAIESTFNSFRLYKKDTAVADLLTETQYSFSTNGSIQHFQIIAQIVKEPSTQNDIFLLPIIIGVILFVIIGSLVFFWYKRKK